MMQLRLAQAKDLDELFELYKDEKGDNLKLFEAIVNIEKVTESLKHMIEVGAIVVAEIEGKIVGGVAGYFMPISFTGDIVFATKYFYFKDSYRNMAGLFLKRVSEFLKRINPGLRQVAISAPAGKSYRRLRRIYRLLGFSFLESFFVKGV